MGLIESHFTLKIKLWLRAVSVLFLAYYLESSLLLWLKLKWVGIEDLNKHTIVEILNTIFTDYTTRINLLYYSNSK